MPEGADHVGQSVAGALQNLVSHIGGPRYKYPPHPLRVSASHQAPSLSSPPPPLTSGQVTMSAVQVESAQQDIVERKQSISDSSSVLKRTTADEAATGEPQEVVEDDKGHSWTSYERLRPYILVGLALLILAWWISSIVLPATRHRWFVFPISNPGPRSIRSYPARSVVFSRIVQTFWAWTFIL